MIVGLTAGFVFAVTASMSTSRTPTTAAGRLSRLAIDALQAADEFLALLLDEGQAELQLAPTLSIFAMVLDHLEDALYQAENLDQSHRADDLAINHALAGVK